MKLFGRQIAIQSIPRKSLELGQMMLNSREFRRPDRLWKSYLSGSLPPDGLFELRTGEKICLSGNPHDPITVMVIFCRKEYGEVKPGDVVVDIGANIGAFSVYAARSGASKVISLEPNTAAQIALRRNIEINGYGHVVEALNRAISAKTGERVFIPVLSSPYNKSRMEGDPSSEAVETISLDDLVESTGCIDILKIDCEGAEYDVFLNCRAETLRSIKSVRMELHPVKDFAKSEVISRLEKSGLRLTKHANMIYWYDR